MICTALQAAKVQPAKVQPAKVQPAKVQPAKGLLLDLGLVDDKTIISMQHHFVQAVRSRAQYHHGTG